MVNAVDKCAKSAQLVRFNEIVCEVGSPEGPAKVNEAIKLISGAEAISLYPSLQYFVRWESCANDYAKKLLSLSELHPNLLGLSRNLKSDIDTFNQKNGSFV